MKSLKESILHSTETGREHFGMKCIAYGGDARAEKFLDLVKDTGWWGDYTLTDNGALDLQKKNINGVYVWCGYQHGKKSRALKSKLLGWTQRVYDAMIKAYGFDPNKVHTEDHTNETDMWRIWGEY